MSGWTSLDTSIITIGIVCAMACALPGAILVLRQMSMMGDAISHTVLPGLAVAFLVTGSRDSVPMFIGAALVGVLTAVLVQAIQNLGRTETSASMGVVLTVLFAIGLILLRFAIDHVDLDPDCVLYGNIVLVATDSVELWGLTIPRAAVSNGIMLMINATVIGVLFKEFRVSSFDPALSTTVGINAQVMHYLLMAMVAATTVAAFATVGSILVIAMLIVPGAAAHLLTNRLAPMLAVSMAIGAASAVLGHLGAIMIPPLFGFEDASTSGMMAVAAGVLFGLAWLFAPQRGLISVAYHQASLGLQVLAEDLLGMLFRLEESNHENDGETVVELACRALGVRRLSVRFALHRLRRRGLVEQTDASDLGVQLTDAGRAAAGQLVRSHRLWEVYLDQHFDLPSDHLHGSAMRLEHVTSDETQRRLADEAGDPPVDPHGHPIPPQ